MDENVGEAYQMSGGEIAAVVFFPLAAFLLVLGALLWTDWKYKQFLRMREARQQQPLEAHEMQTGTYSVR